jgi:hypothetical protein
MCSMLSSTNNNPLQGVSMDALLSNSLITTTFRRQRLLNDTINAEAGEAAGPEQ